MFKSSLRMKQWNILPYVYLYHLRLEGQYDSAIGYLQHTLYLDPNCVQCHINLASLYCDMSNYNKAIIYFEKVIMMGSKMSAALTRYLSCLKVMCKYDYCVCNTVFYNLNKDSMEKEMYIFIYFWSLITTLVFTLPHSPWKSKHKIKV